MDAILTSIISQLKNPWQYICVGVAWGYIIYFDINREYLAPATLCAMGVAYIIRQIIKFIFDKITLYKWKKQVLFNLLHMNPEEKSIIWHCFSNNIQTTNINGLYDGMSAWYSLSQKYIAVHPAGAHSMKDLPITITSPVWEIIKKHKNEIFAEYLNDEE